ncbi:hypothetical protein BDI4_1880005 [Burkholderia diffusa]|nr:hypothetical protein BDI4_1880005 [Burkholderia diffusa]
MCTTCYPNCSDQPLCDVNMPCQTRLNDVSFVARYRYDEECGMHRLKRLRELRGRLQRQVDGTAL